VPFPLGGAKSIDEVTQLFPVKRNGQILNSIGASALLLELGLLIEQN